MMLSQPPLRGAVGGAAWRGIHGARRRLLIRTVAGRRTSLCRRIRRDDRLTAFARGVGGILISLLHTHLTAPGVACYKCDNPHQITGEDNGAQTLFCCRVSGSARHWFYDLSAPAWSTTCSGRYKTRLQYAPMGSAAPVPVLEFYQNACAPDAGIA
jgi:hypothetical protein